MKFVEVSSGEEDGVVEMIRARVGAVVDLFDLNLGQQMRRCGAKILHHLNQRVVFKSRFVLVPDVKLSLGKVRGLVGKEQLPAGLDECSLVDAIGRENPSAHGCCLRRKDFADQGNKIGRRILFC